MATRRLTNGNDRFTDSNASNTIFGLRGNDLINGARGNDRLHGDEGNDTINGDAGNDQLFGEDGRDTLNGDDGNDQLFGAEGVDQLRGGDGADRLGGGLGNDVLDAGVDLFQDTFVFQVDTASESGRDTIRNYDDTRDLINLGDFGTFGDLDVNGDGRLNFFDEGNGVINVSSNRITIDVGRAFEVDFGGQQTITVLGITELGPEDLRFT